MVSTKSRLLCILLIFTFLFSQTVAFASSSDIQKSIFNDDFESYQVGATNVGSYGGGAKGNYWELKEENGNKFFEMKVNTKSDCHLDGYISSPVSDKFVFEIKVRLKDYGKVDKLIQIITSDKRDIITFELSGKNFSTVYIYDRYADPKTMIIFN